MQRIILVFSKATKLSIPLASSNTPRTRTDTIHPMSDIVTSPPLQEPKVRSWNLSMGGGVPGDGSGPYVTPRGPQGFAELPS